MSRQYPLAFVKKKEFQVTRLLVMIYERNEPKLMLVNTDPDEIIDWAFNDRSLTTLQLGDALSLLAHEITHPHDSPLTFTEIDTVYAMLAEIYLSRCGHKPVIEEKVNWKEAGF